MDASAIVIVMVGVVMVLLCGASYRIGELHERRAWVSWRVMRYR